MIRVPLYGAKVHVIIADHDTSFKYAARAAKVTPKRKTLAKGKDVVAAVTPTTTPGTWAVFLRPDADGATLCHEIIHLTTFIAHHYGLSYAKRKRDEHIAYLADFLFKELERHIQAYG